MPKFSRLIKARLPISGYIEEVKNVWQIMQSNPIGVDNLSDTGYEQVIKNLEYYKNDIDNQDSNMNVIWAILKEYAPYFTFVQYMQLGELAHKYLD